MAQTLQIDTPVMSIGEFARRIGVSESAVKKRVSCGELPVVRFGLDAGKGSTPFINTAKLTQLCMEQAFEHPILGSV